MIKVLDYLGFFHARANPKLIANELPFGWGIRVLDDPKAFGSNHGKLRSLLDARPDIKLVGFHRHWDPAHNSQEAICSIQKLMKALPAYEDFARDYGAKTTVLISHTLEYNCSIKIKINARIRRMEEHAPSCVISQSCMKGYFDPAHMQEKHGFQVADVVSSDGIDVWDMNTSTWLRNNKDSFAVCAWFHSCNGRVKGEAPKPYPLRTNFPTKTELRRAFKVMGE